MEQRRTIRVTVRLDVENDADLIAWLQGLTPGGRSALIRDTWRRGLQQVARWDSVDINELRGVIAEELAKALATQSLPISQEINSPQEVPDIEAQYGAKLDKMLGGLSKLQDRPKRLTRARQNVAS